MAEVLVSLIDDKGFISADLEVLANEMKLQIKSVNKVQKLIQECDPIGIGANGVQETLYIQSKILYPENKILHEDQTQIFIETPYRNQKLFQFITKVCSEKTMLCVACNINASDEFIKSKSIENWKKSKLDINKKNTIFLLYK